MKIELNKEEAQVLVNMIDIAVKSAGLQAAEAGVHFSKLIQAAAKAEEDAAANVVELPQAAE
jgi:hypothetical protein